MRTDGNGGSDLPLLVRWSLAAHSLWIESNGRQGARADLRNQDLRDLDLSGAELSGADLSGADLRGACLDRGRYRLACLSGAHLDGASIHKACFDGADLDLAVFDRARLTGCRFDAIDIVAGDDAPVRGARAARLTGARFRRAELRGCSFRGADLGGVSFATASLADCDFAGARMSPKASEQARLANCRLSAEPPPQPGVATAAFTDLGRPLQRRRPPA
ncbi:MAG: pentapeptide repeat-containing protein [Thalassobaculum sp.]|uniref:pentapeptide repeat-containing protein n=1 Tax=Thalassobaculum sp. TaxID=2022740 RepID=UPI0032ED6D08